MTLLKKSQAEVIILIIIVVIIVGFGVYYFSPMNKAVIQQNITQNSTQNNSQITINQSQNSCINTTTKTYLKSGSLCVINFLCLEGTTAFKDSCGCGCQVASNVMNTTSQVYNIKIQGFAFVPSTLTINQGDTVIWTNLDSAEHSIKSDSGTELSSDIIGQTGTYSHTFNNIGTYDYHCGIHTSMMGTIIVSNEGVSSSSSSSSSSDSSSSGGY